VAEAAFGVDTAAESSLARESVRFAFVGAFCTVLDVGLFNLITFGASADPILAKIISTVVSVTVSYLLNSRWTFAGPDRKAAGRWQFAVYAAINVASAGISVACLRLAERLNLHGVIWLNTAAFAVVLVVGTFARFVIYRRWLFAGRRPPAVNST
jgi:putative flippase GtrA